MHTGTWQHFKDHFFFVDYLISSTRKLKSNASKAVIFISTERFVAISRQWLANVLGGHKSSGSVVLCLPNRSSHDVTGRSFFVYTN